MAADIFRRRIDDHRSTMLHGRMISGAAVLSTISGMPNRLPISATSAIGKISSLGLGRDSHNRRGSVIGGPGKGLRIGGIDKARLDAEILQRGGKQRPGAAISPAAETMLSPARATLRMAKAEAACPEDKASAAAPPSSSANRCSKASCVGLETRV